MYVIKARVKKDHSRKTKYKNGEEKEVIFTPVSGSTADNKHAWHNKHGEQKNGELD